MNRHFAVLALGAFLVEPIFIGQEVHGQHFAWAKQFGGTARDVANRMVLDPTGKVYTVGYFEGTADFDPGPGAFNMTSAGGYDAFISKLDSAGNFVWAKELSGTEYQEAADVALDSTGNVYTMGYFTGTVDFDPGPDTVNLTSGAVSLFISKLDSAGNFVWARNVPVGGIGAPNNLGGVSLDSSDNVYAIGTFEGLTDFDPGVGTFNMASAGGSPDAFILKLDNAGIFVWAKRLGGTSVDNAFDVALDSIGNVYTVGVFSSSPADFDPGPGTFDMSSAGSDVFVSKLNNGGGFVWAKQLSGAGDDFPHGVTLDSSGNAYTVGGFSGIADFDPGPGILTLTSAGGVDAFISKLDSLGNFVWAKRLGGTSSDFAWGVSLDSSGNIHTVGSFSSNPADFDPGPGTFNLTSAGSHDVFISELDNAGDFVWAEQLGGTGLDRGHDVAADATGNVHTVGLFSGTADFDPGPGTFSLTSAGTSDGFVCKLRTSSSPGRIPPTMRVDRISPAIIRLSWQMSTCGGATDYGIYEGSIGNWQSHALVDCHDDGGDLVEQVSTSSNDSYYIVVPLTSTVEGSYGLGSGSSERPPAATACAPLQELGCP